MITVAGYRWRCADMVAWLDAHQAQFDDALRIGVVFSADVNTKLRALIGMQRTWYGHALHQYRILAASDADIEPPPDPLAEVGRRLSTDAGRTLWEQLLAQTTPADAGAA